MLKKITGSRSTEYLRREWERQREKKRIWKVEDFDGNHRNGRVEFHPYGCETDRDPHHHWIERTEREAVRHQQQRQRDHHYRRERPNGGVHHHEWTRTVRYHESPALNTALKENLPVPARPPSENQRADIRKRTNLVETFKKISLEEYRTRRNLQKKNPAAELKSHEIRVVLPGNEDEDVQIDDSERPPTPGKGLEVVLYSKEAAEERLRDSKIHRPTQL